MGKMSLDRAKKLSEKKWKFIVENDGSDSGLTKKIKSLENYQSHCAMCHYQLEVMDSDCDHCLYTEVCHIPYFNWTSFKSVNHAQIVLNEIIKTNNK